VSVQKPYGFINDRITGKSVPDIGAEANRQAMERILTEEKGYLSSDIEVDAPLSFTVAGESYRSSVDLVVSVAGTRAMVIKCAAGSLGSREREIVSAGRLLDTYQIPLAVVSDGVDAVVLDTPTGKKRGEGMVAVPCKGELEEYMKRHERVAYPEKKREREQLVFRTYDMENVNILKA
jgi:Type I restriction enzyme R protein N terminus (HSDR_N)